MCHRGTLFAKKVIKSPIVKIDIITPTNNRLEFLKENIRSVKCSTTYPLDLEIVHLIHDCGSSDGTGEWLKSEADDEGLSIMTSPERVFPGVARNLALKGADGDFIMPLDDDDLVLQRTLYHFVHALTSETAGASWVVSDYVKMDQNGRYLIGEDYYGWIFPTEKEMLQAIFSGRHLIQGNVCFRRDLFQKVGGYSTTLETAEDLELYVRFILEAGLPKYVPVVSHLHRIHEDNISKGVTKERYNEDMKTIYQLHREELVDRGIEFIPIP